MLVSPYNDAIAHPATAGASAGAGGETKLIRDVIRACVRVNARLNLVARALLIAVALIALASAFLYVHLHGQQMVDAIGAAGGVDAAELIALTSPVLLFAMLAVLTAAVAWMMHRRGQDELCRTLDVLTRLKREEGVGVSARGLMFAFEEHSTMREARSPFCCGLAGRCSSSASGSSGLLSSTRSPFTSRSC